MKQFPVASKSFTFSEVHNILCTYSSNLWVTFYCFLKPIKQTLKTRRGKKEINPLGKTDGTNFVKWFLPHFLSTLWHSVMIFAGCLGHRCVSKLYQFLHKIGMGQGVESFSRIIFRVPTKLFIGFLGFKWLLGGIFLLNNINKSKVEQLSKGGVCTFCDLQ